MRLPEKLPLYAKWVVVWLVVLYLVYVSRWWIVYFSSSASAGNCKRCHRDACCRPTNKIARHYPRRGYHQLNF